MKAVDIASVVSVVIDIAASSIIAPSSQGARRSNRAATYAMSAMPGSSPTIRRALAVVRRPATRVKAAISSSLRGQPRARTHRWRCSTGRIGPCRPVVDRLMSRMICGARTGTTSQPGADRRHEHGVRALLRDRPSTRSSTLVPEARTEPDRSGSVAPSTISPARPAMRRSSLRGRLASAAPPADRPR
jgi:hypothetical protein